MITRINWYGEAGLFLPDDEVEEVAGTLNVLCDRLDCDEEDQLVVDASALCLRLVQGLTGVLPTLRPVGAAMDLPTEVQLGKADWIYDDDLGCHIPCCSQSGRWTPRCGNGPLVGDAIVSGSCGEQHEELDSGG